MDKYYLLTFNEDFADKFDVPALECMTEEEYNNWLLTHSGELNPNYIEEKENWDLQIKAYEHFKEEMEIKGLYNKSLLDYTNIEKYWYDNNKVDYPNIWRAPKKMKKSYLRVFLGNSSDNFEDHYLDLCLMEEFVEQGLVEVKEVNKNFYDIFKEVKLNNLSLCNIFHDFKE